MPVTKLESSEARNSRFGNFTGRTHATHRDPGHDPGYGLLRERSQDRCIDCAGTDDVGADLAILEFKRPGPEKDRTAALLAL